jgi:hypothetical protein
MLVDEIPNQGSDVLNPKYNLEDEKNQKWSIMKNFVGNDFSPRIS